MILPYDFLTTAHHQQKAPRQKNLFQMNKYVRSIIFILNYSLFFHVRCCCCFFLPSKFGLFVPPLKSICCCCWFALIWLNDFLSGILDKINRNNSTHSSAAHSKKPVSSENLKMMWKSMLFGNSYRWTFDEAQTNRFFRFGNQVREFVDLNGSNCFRRFWMGERMDWVKRWGLTECIFHLNSDLRIQIVDCWCNLYLELSAYSILCLFFVSIFGTLVWLKSDFLRHITLTSCILLSSMKNVIPGIIIGQILQWTMGNRE